MWVDSRSDSSWILDFKGGPFPELLPNQTQL